MAQWQVKGANVSTGLDVDVAVYAESADEAIEQARAAGILVESVQDVPDAQADVTTLVPPYERKPTDTAHSGSRSRAPMPMGALAPSAVRVPDYSPLTVLSRVLTVLAILGYVAVALMTGLGLLAAALGGQISGPVGAMSALFALLWGALALIPSLVLHALGAALTALRDIAKNSWEWRAR